MQDAVAYWDARFHSGSGSLPNLGTGNQPVWGQLPGVAGAYFSTPDSAANSITGDIDIICRVALDDWTPAANNQLMSKYGAAGDRTFQFVVTATTGVLNFTWSADGTSTLPAVVSTAAPAVSDGSALWVRVTLDVDDGAGNHVAKFYTAADSATIPSSWTQLGDTVTVAGTTSIFNSAAAVEVGARTGGTAGFLAGKVYRALLKNGIGGTTVNDYDPTIVTNTSSATFVATTGETWTKNGTAAWGGKLDLALPGGTNDPLFLAYAGEKYARLPGVAGNYVSTPDSAAVSITGDIDIIARVAMDDWTPAAPSTVVAKEDSASLRSYRFDVGTAGTLVISTSADGSTAVNNTSTASPAFTDGSTYWVRATLDVDDGAGNRVAKFYTAADQATVPSSWTQLGATVTTAGATSIQDNASELAVGADRLGSIQPLAGKVYRAIVKNGIDGTTVADYDPSRSVEPHSTFTASTGEVWTHNRAASGRKLTLVDRAGFLFGTDDYLSVADNALLDFAAGDSFTVIIAMKRHGGSATQNFLAKKSGNSTLAGYQIRAGTGTPTVLGPNFSDGVGTVTDGYTDTKGTVSVHSMVRDVATDAMIAYNDATGQTPVTDTTTASLENALDFQIGRNPSPANYADFYFIGAAVFRRALSVAEIAQVVREFGVIA